MYLGATILVIVAGIIVILLLTALLMKVEDFFFGETATTQVKNPNNEGANKIENDVEESTKINQN